MDSLVDILTVLEIEKIKIGGDCNFLIVGNTRKEAHHCNRDDILNAFLELVYVKINKAYNILTHLLISAKTIYFHTEIM